ncbi:CD109 antigen-like isoform X2 [Chironomus tepperi]
MPRSAIYTLRIQTNSNSKCAFQSEKVYNLKQYPLTFIYIDKPIYKPGDKMTFRIFVLGQDMLPYSDDLKVDVRLMDSNRIYIQNITDLKTTQYGFAEKSFTIPETAHFGDWKIDVQANNRKKSKNFKVQPKNEANFDVFLKMSDKIAVEDQIFMMTFITRTEKGNIFEGTAKISVTGKNWGSDQNVINKIVKPVSLMGNKVNINLKIKEDLGISTAFDDMDLTFDVDVTENSTQNVINVKKEVRMYHKGRSVIQVVRKKFFKPGFKFPIKIRVKDMNGQPDNSLNQLKMRIEYLAADGKTKSEKNLQINLKNGETLTTLTPADDTAKIRINFEFGDTKMIENIPKFSTYGIDEYLQVSFINKSSKVGDTIQLQAQSSGEMETLNLMIFGTNGLIYSEEFPDAVGKDLYNFNIQLTDEMKPEIRGLVFYTRPSDGVMVYDDFSLALGFSIDNSLEISAPATAKPNEEIEITVKSEQDSFVLLTGIDDNAELFNNENEISRFDIYNELTYYLNFSFLNAHEYKFDKVNNFVLEPLQKGTKCGGKQSPPKNPDPNDDAKAWTQKYFPNSWFDKVFNMKSGTETIKVKVPNELKTWRIYGVSVHRSKGFTVAKNLPEIVVKSEFAVNIKAPNVVKENEVFQVDISAYNFEAGYIQPSIQIEITSGLSMIVNEQTQEHSGKVCYKFPSYGRTSMQLSKQLDPQNNTQIGSFYVKSGWNNEQIKATSWLNQATYEFVKDIKVKTAEHGSPNNIKFKTTVSTISDAKANVVIKTKLESSYYSTSSLVMEVDLPSGYTYDSHKIEDHIQDSEYDAANNLVKFSLNSLEPYRSYEISITIEKVFNVYECAKSMIRVYDANRPDQKSISSYMYDVNAQMCHDVAEATKCSWKVWNCFG